MPADKLKVTILADGALKIETDKISDANHMSADRFMAFLADELGVVPERVRKTKGHAHAHDHEHDHEHEKESA